MDTSHGDDDVTPSSGGAADDLAVTEQVDAMKRKAEELAAEAYRLHVDPSADAGADD